MGLILKFYLVKSVLKPFMTDITIIKIATPSIIPKKENIEIIFKKPSFFLGLKFLNRNKSFCFCKQCINFLSFLILFFQDLIFHFLSLIL